MAEKRFWDAPVPKPVVTKIPDPEPISIIPEEPISIIPEEPISILSRPIEDSESVVEALQTSSVVTKNLPSKKKGKK